MKTLSLKTIEKIDLLARPEVAEHINIFSAASAVFTDFKTLKPLVIKMNTAAVDVEHLMKQSHVRLKIVIDEKGHFMGLVSLQMLHSQEMQKHVAQGFPREQLLLSDFMLPKDALKGIDYQELSKARICDVIDTLKHSQHQHCLVVDEQRDVIRGLISANDIVRKLKLPIDVSLNPSFMEIADSIEKVKVAS
ncbi:CBS domain-containing protein [Shewanella sp. 10N.7]|uniref:CBS domain-containing protein n=1 Tax=Shewanella sp. 10N.7 TaxID=2885093 RepID=UPI001E33DE4E|nr:CBS domain-containing protein [Shewanella sp. 10N.7]MCC4834589.1 CBS domain-containing protein [Shewanella sp. 10N.7]